MLYHILATLGPIVRLWIVENYSSKRSEQTRRVDEHDPVYQTIAARSPKKARAAMEAHMDAAGQRLLATIERKR